MKEHSGGPWIDLAVRRGRKVCWWHAFSRTARHATPRVLSLHATAWKMPISRLGAGRTASLIGPYILRWTAIKIARTGVEGRLYRSYCCKASRVHCRAAEDALLAAYERAKATSFRSGDRGPVGDCEPVARDGDAVIFQWNVPRAIALRELEPRLVVEPGFQAGFAPVARRCSSLASLMLTQYAAVYTRTLAPDSPPAGIAG